MKFAGVDRTIPKKPSMIELAMGQVNRYRQLATLRQQSPGEIKFAKAYRKAMGLGLDVSSKCAKGFEMDARGGCTPMLNSGNPTTSTAVPAGPETFVAPDDMTCPEGFELVPWTEEELKMEKPPAKKCRRIGGVWRNAVTTGGYGEMDYSEAQHVCTRDNPPMAMPNGKYICASQRKIDPATQKPVPLSGFGGDSVDYLDKYAIFFVAIGVGLVVYLMKRKRR